MKKNVVIDVLCKVGVALLYVLSLGFGVLGFFGGAIQALDFFGYLDKYKK